jgi:hypothetical protein
MTDIDSRSIGDALDELNSKLHTLATAWGEELGTSAGIEFDKRELWLVRSGDGWEFVVIDKKRGAKTQLRSCASTTRIEATQPLADLRARIILVRGATREEIENGLTTIEKLIEEAKE